MARGIQDFERDLEESIRNEVRVLLIGKSGSGKSKTGNTLLGEKKFQSRRSPNPVTIECNSAVRDYQGRRFVVVDGPGLFFDEKFSEITMKEELAKALYMLAPGPHVLILVLGVDRFDESEVKAIDMYKKAFGAGIMDHVLVVFTGKDQLDDEEISIDNYVKLYTKEQTKFLESCGNRYFAINNNASESEKEKQAMELMNKVLELEKANRGKYFCNDELKLAETEAEKKLREMHEKNPEDDITVLRASLRLEMTRGSSESNHMLNVLIAGSFGIVTAVSVYAVGINAVMKAAAK